MVVVVEGEVESVVVGVSVLNATTLCAVVSVNVVLVSGIKVMTGFSVTYCLRTKRALVCDCDSVT